MKVSIDALNNKDYKLAIEKLEKAVHESPTYTMARQNLSIAHSNYGATLMSQPQKALEEFHKAMLLDLASDSKRYDVDKALRALDLKVGSYEERLKYSEQAEKCGDYVGAVIECAESLRLHDSEAIRARLWSLYPRLDPMYQAVPYKSLLPVATVRYERLSDTFLGVPKRRH